jgi:hypothetical protein
VLCDSPALAAEKEMIIQTMKRVLWVYPLPSDGREALRATFAAEAAACYQQEQTAQLPHLFTVALADSASITGPDRQLASDCLDSASLLGRAANGLIIVRCF